jgi:hypothetical protein
LSGFFKQQLGQWASFLGTFLSAYCLMQSE